MYRCNYSIYSGMRIGNHVRITAERTGKALAAMRQIMPRKYGRGNGVELYTRHSDLFCANMVEKVYSEAEVSEYPTPFFYWVSREVRPTLYKEKTGKGPLRSRSSKNGKNSEEDKTESKSEPRGYYPP